MSCHPSHVIPCYLSPVIQRNTNSRIMSEMVSDDVVSNIYRALGGGGGSVMEPVIVTAAPLLDQEVRVMSLLHSVPAAYGKTRRLMLATSFHSSSTLMYSFPCDLAIIVHHDPCVWPRQRRGLQAGLQPPVGTSSMTKCVKVLRAKQSKAKHGPITGSDQTVPSL